MDHPLAILNNGKTNISYSAVGNTGSPIIIKRLMVEQQANQMETSMFLKMRMIILLILEMEHLDL